jgi:glycosyltransferase involved in cell wall biosynthesis
VKGVVAVDGTSYGAAPTGAARRTRELLPRLAERGWRPLLFVGRHAAGAFGGLGGVEVVPVPVPSGPGPWRALLARRALPERLRRSGVEILLSETPPFPGDLPVVLTVHDPRAWDAPALTPVGRRLWVRRVLPAALRRADAVVAVSAWTAERLGALFPGCRPRVIRNGADHLGPPAPRVPRDFVLAVGPWGPHKGLEDLLAAWPRVRRACSTARLMLTDADASARRRLTRPPAGVETVCADDARMRELLAGARAVVRPSRFEGFDLPLAEALHAGCPVVASDIPVHRELLGRRALLVRPEDPAALADAVTAAFDEPPPELPSHPELPRWDAAADALDTLLDEVRRA